MRDFRYDPKATLFDPLATAFTLDNALLCAAASNLAYEQAATVEPEVGAWGFPRFQWIQARGKDIDTQGYVCAGPRAVLIAFRGSEANIRDWLTNLRFETVPGPVSKVHRGFYEALTEDGLIPAAPSRQILEAVSRFRDRGQPLWVTGHSLGGALAVLCAARLHLTEGVPVQGVYTFGQPRVGDYGFASAFDRAFAGRVFRFVNNNDIVPTVPPVGLILRYWHVEREVYIDEDRRLDTTISPGRRLLANAKGRLRDVGEIGSDGLKDHFMNAYIGAVRGAAQK